VGNPYQIDNAFGYLANTYGPGLVRGLGGPDAFLANQNPGQALTDTFRAAQYQQAGEQAIATANAAGNAEVAKKLLGFEAAKNGGKPASKLDIANAHTGAAVLNNPVFKSFMAQQIGPENLEGVMFGRRGDPSATAAAVHSMGFYRPDAATGARRMSAASLDSFSTQMHDTMFGEDANLDEMHGFGGIAAGEITKTLFQQGKLSRSLGGMTAAERVRVMGTAKRDDKTIQRMAEKFGHDDLMATDSDYAAANGDERKGILAQKVGKYKTQLQTTFKEIDKFSKNDPRSKSAEEIEQMGGFSTAANALDARRAGRIVKEHTGALAAMREIFGDNGRPNAPVPELMAALQQLTNGAQTALSPQKVEKLVREMRVVARQTGMSAAELVATHQQDLNYGQQIGLSESTVDRGQAMRNLGGKAMADAGMFDTAGAGKMNRAEAEQNRRMLSLRGDKSSIGQSLATLNRVVSESPDKYKGTELAAAVEAYRKGAATYEYNGKTVNLTEMAAKRGVSGVFNMARESGASNAQLYAYFRDKENTEAYTTTDYGMRIQRERLLNDASVTSSGEMRGRLSSKEAKQALKPSGMSDTEYRNRSEQTSTLLTRKLADVIMDETADMSADSRAKVMERRSKEILTEHFMSKAGGGHSASKAKAMAQQHLEHMVGKTESERATGFNTIYGEMSARLTYTTGRNMAAHTQTYAEKVLKAAEQQRGTVSAQADQSAAVSAGNEAALSQRIGEELDRLGEGKSGSFSDSLKRVGNVQFGEDILQRYAPEMRGGLKVASSMYQNAKSDAEKQRANIIFNAHNIGTPEHVAAGARAMAQQFLGPRASEKDIKEFAKLALDSDSAGFEKKIKGGFFGGGLSKQRQEEALALSKSLREASRLGGLESAGLEQTPEARAAREAEAAAAAAAVGNVTGVSSDGQLNYDYDKLGVKKELTAEQKKLLQDISQDPTGGTFAAIMQDKDKRGLRAQLLTIPDQAAVDMFNKLPAAERKAALERMKGLNNSALSKYGIGLSGAEAQNFDRLVTAIDKNEQQTPTVGMTPEATQQAHQQGMGTSVSYAEQRPVDPQELAKVQAEREAMLKQLGGEDKAKGVQRYEELTQRKAELESGNPLAYVDKQIFEVNKKVVPIREQTGFWATFGLGAKTGEEAFDNPEDQKRHAFLISRRNALAGDADNYSQNLMQGAQQTTNKATQAGGGNNAGAVNNNSGGKIDIGGTLVLQGLNEVIMRAAGRRMEEPSGGGASVDFGML